MSLQARPVRAMRAVLQVSLACMAAAVAWRDAFHGGPVFSVLFLAWDWSESAALGFVRGASLALAFIAVAIQFRRGWPALVVLSLWMVALGAAAMHGQPATAALEPGARAIRVVAPVALAVLLAGSGLRLSAARVRLVVVLLQFAIAATFVCHGLEALAAKPAFLDYLFAAGGRIGIDVSPRSAEVLLLVIGVLDIVLAAALLLGSPRFQLASALYMSVWGVVTALARMVHSGWDGLSETLLRLPHAAAPFALYLFWRAMARSADPVRD